MKKIAIAVVFLAMAVWCAAGYCQYPGQGSSSSSQGNGGQTSTVQGNAGQDNSGQGNPGQESMTGAGPSSGPAAISDNPQQAQENSERDLNKMEDQMDANNTAQKQEDELRR